MRQHVTVVPADNLIIVNGEALRFDFSTPANLHAIQWHDGQGHLEWTDDYNHPLHGETLYAEEIAPFVALWETEKARIDAVAAQEEAQRIAEYNSVEARAMRVREERDKRIAAHRWIVDRHRDQTDAGEPTTLNAEQYSAWLTYLQALRDLPAMEGFPWTGGGEDDATCPWPEQPALPLKVGL